MRDPWRSQPAGSPARRSPLVPSAWALAAGLACRESVAPGLAPSPALVATASGVALVAIALLVRARVPAAVRSPLWLGLPFLTGIVIATPRSILVLEPGPHAVEGVVASPPRHVAERYGRPSSLRFELDRVRVDGSPRSGRLRVTAPEFAIGRGDRLELRVWARHGAATQRVSHPSHCSVVGTSPRGALDRARHDRRRAWSHRYSRDVSAWFQALLLGERSGLPPATVQTFRAIGQSHLLAISGLHVGILLAVFAAALTRIRWLPTRARAWLLAGLAVVYAGLAGADPPVVRSALLGALATVATLRRRPNSAGNTLAAALLGLVALDPTATGELGFVLTFAAVASILAIGVPRRRFPRLRTPRRPDQLAGGVSLAALRRYGTLGLRVSFAAWLGTAIPLALVQPDVVPLAPLFALLLTPILTLLLVTSLAALLPATPLDLAVDQFASVVIVAFEAASRLLESCPATPTQWPPSTGSSWCLALASVAIALAARRVTKSALATLSLAVLAAIPSPRLPQLVVPHLGRGQCAIVATPGATIVLDAGSVDRRDGGAAQIGAEMWRLHRRHIDALVLSHPHADHVVAIPGLLRRVTVGRAFVGPRFGAEPLGQTVISHLARAGVPVETIGRGARWRIGDVLLEALHPLADAGLATSPNDDSLVVRLRCGELDVLAPGDLEEQGCAATRTRCHGDIVLLPHHGRACELLAPWFRATGGRIGIASSTGPASESVEAIRGDHGVTVGLTSELGDLRIVPHDAGWLLERRDPQRPRWNSTRPWSTVPSP